jgi:GDPmannose 4,6-dehydratase
MMQQEEAEDFVLATGVLTSVRDFAKAAFGALEIQLDFKGAGENECGWDLETKREVIRVDPRFYRPADPCFLIGNPTKASVKLGWKADTNAVELAALMAQADWASLANPDGESDLPAASKGG